MVTSYGQGQYSASAGPSEAHQWATSRLYKPTSGARLVLWMHSAGGLASEPFIASNSVLPLVNAITALGGPIMSYDGQAPAGGSAAHWGNDTAQARTTDAMSFAAANVGAVTSKVILVGVSMGGMLALNWARANPSKVQAIALFYPATSLQAIHDGTGGAANGQASTEAAYGGSTAAFNAAVAAHDPAQNAAAVAALGVPMKMWYSTADTVVGTANQTAFAAAVGSALQTQSLGAASHADMTQISVSDAVTWLANYI